MAGGGGGEGGGSGAAGPSKASEVAVPDQYICSITAEIMTDPVNTVRLALCRRCARRPPLVEATPCLWPVLACTHRRPLTVAKQADGFTYERSAIEQWLENHNTSPKTGVELESKQLIPNHSLRSLIQDLNKPGV